MYGRPSSYMTSAVILTPAKELKEQHSTRGPYGIRVTEHKQRLSR